MLERIGAYAASELSLEEMREVEQLILEDAEALRLAETYLRMLAMPDKGLRRRQGWKILWARY
jgi:hypothetical protein